MTVARRVLGVVLGYAIFAVSAVLLFQLTRRNPHAEQPTLFMAGSIAYGIIFAAIGGYVSAVCGGGSPRVQGSVVGIMIALGAMVSLLAGPKAGSVWSRVAAPLLMAPSAAIAGIIRARQVTRQGTTDVSQVPAGLPNSGMKVTELSAAWSGNGRAGSQAKRRRLKKSDSVGKAHAACFRAPR